MEVARKCFGGTKCVMEFEWVKGGSGVCGGGGGGEFNAFVFNDSDFTGSWSWLATNKVKTLPIHLRHTSCLWRRKSLISFNFNI